MSISGPGVVILDSSCLSFLEPHNNLNRVLNNMRTVDLQIRLSAINILEAVKTPSAPVRNCLLQIIREVSEGRPFLPWPHDLIKRSGQAMANGKHSFWSDESGLEKALYENSITDRDVDPAQKIMDSLESDFTNMHNDARNKIQPLLRKNNSLYWDTAKAFLDQIWTTKSHFEYYALKIWEKIGLPKNPNIETLWENEIWRIFHEINGFAAFERAFQKKTPKRVHYPDLLQLIYVANNPRRIVVSKDKGFLRAARTILQNRYRCVRILECSDL